MVDKDGFPLEVIGRSEEGRPLHVFYAGAKESSWRVLILAGQHGDEGESRAAVESYLRDFRGRRGPSRVCVAGVSDLNPDGSTKNRRLNARGIDLNRDHLLLAAAETRALHQFVRSWRPHLILDVHTYPPRRKHLLLHNLVYCHDVFLDEPSNPGICQQTCEAEAATSLETILEQVNAQGYRAGRYVLSTPSGKVRHSTLDVTDVRNGLALRYDVPTYLIEGRKPLKKDDNAVRVHLRAALKAAIDVIVQGAEGSFLNRRKSLPALHEGAIVAIRARHLPGHGPCIMPFLDSSTGTIRMAEFPGVYCPAIKITKCIRLPAAYAVPQSHVALIEALSRHGFSNEPALPARIYTVEQYWARKREDPVHPGRQPAKLALETLMERRELTDHVLFPVIADGGRALAVYLEPESKYGLKRYAALKLTLRGNSTYPILRVVSS